MARFDDDIMRQIRALYWPRVDEEGNPIPLTNPTKGYDLDRLPTDAIYDPNVVWVGSFVDAMIHFKVFKGRSFFKDFMFEVNDKGPAGGFNFSLERCLGLGETKWPHLDATYPPANQMLALHSLPGAPGDSSDPGELLTSPARSGVTGELFPSPSKKVYDEILIAVDPQYQLHILRRGDRIRKSFKDQQRGIVREVFSLRPLAEGDSAIPGVQSETPIRV